MSAKPFLIQHNGKPTIVVEVPEGVTGPLFLGWALTADEARALAREPPGVFVRGGAGGAVVLVTEADMGAVESLLTADEARKLARELLQCADVVEPPADEER